MMHEVTDGVSFRFIATDEPTSRLALVVKTDAGEWFRPLSLEEVQSLMVELATATAQVGHAMGERDATEEVDALLDGVGKVHH